MTSRRRGVRTALALMLITTVTACGPKNLAQENDRLRAQVMDLDAEIDRLQQANAELEAAVAAPLVTDAPDTSPEVTLSTPRVTTLRVGRLSHVNDDDATLVLYLRPTDGRGRFIQMVGHVLVHAAVIPAGGTARTVGRLDVTPAALRDAYRSGFMGTHYTLEVPVTLDGDDANVTVQVEYRDARTGVTLDAQHTVKRG